MPPKPRGVYQVGQKPLSLSGVTFPSPTTYDAAPIQTRPIVWQNTRTSKTVWQIRYYWQPPKCAPKRKTHTEVYISRDAAASWCDPLMHFLNGPRRKGPKQLGGTRRTSSGQRVSVKRRKLTLQDKALSKERRQARRVKKRNNHYRECMKQCRVQFDYIGDRLDNGSVMDLVCPMNTVADAPCGVDDKEEEAGESEAEEEEAGEKEEEEEDIRERHMSNIQTTNEEEAEEAAELPPSWSEKDIQRATTQATAVKIAYHFMREDLADSIQKGRKRAPVLQIMERAAALMSRKPDTIYT